MRWSSERPLVGKRDNALVRIANRWARSGSAREGHQSARTEAANRDALGQAVALTLAVAPLSLAAALRPSFRVAPFSAVLVLLIGGTLGENPAMSAVVRVLTHPPAKAAVCDSNRLALRSERVEQPLLARCDNAGRSSIAPEKLLRAVLLQAFYSIHSERQLISRCGDEHVADRGRSGLTIPETPTLRVRRTAT
jgi:Transposase domain (DUF772)